MVSWQERCTELLRSSNWPTSTWQSKVQPSFRMRSRSSSPFRPQAPQCDLNGLMAGKMHGVASLVKLANFHLAEQGPTQLPNEVQIQFSFPASSSSMRSEWSHGRKDARSCFARQTGQLPLGRARSNPASE